MEKRKNKFDFADTEEVDLDEYDYQTEEEHIKNTEKIAFWFFFRLKPFSSDIGRIIGLIVIYLGLAITTVSILNIIFEKEFGFVYLFVGIVVLFFGINEWAKYKILEKEIREIINEESEEKITSLENKNNEVNYDLLEKIILRTGHRLSRAGFLSEEFLGDQNKDIWGNWKDKNKVRKKIEDAIWHKYNHIKTKQ